MTEANPTPQAPNFSLQDLENAVKVIDAACARGAFRGEEMSGVGAVRDKLVAFITASAPQANAEGEEVAEEAAKTVKKAAPKKAKA